MSKFIRPKKVAILQSNYIPWKGYFDLIAFVDEFILYDDMQYTRRDWRNRNLIKTPTGLQWLTVPVKVKGKFLQKIRDTEIDGKNWIQSHWGSLEKNYRRTPHYDEITTLIKPIFFSQNHQFLSELNRSFIKTICKYLRISTLISDSFDYTFVDDKSERLVNICLQAKASVYVSGPSAKNYIDKNVFSEQGVDLTWFDYSNYPEHPQLWDHFAHGVSILDLLFICGRRSSSYMKFTKS